VKKSMIKGLDRRRFIKQMATAIPSAIAISNVVRADPNITENESTNTEAKKGQGYRESDHIKKYYDKARF